MLAIRFAPGLRVAIALACAYIGMSPARFSVLNAATAVLWAVGLMMLVAWAGPTALEALGIGGWKAAVVVGILVVVAFKILGVVERRSLADGQAM